MRPGTSSCVWMACTPGSASAAAKSIDRIRACGWGLRTVVPHSIPSAQRSDEYANSPLTFSLPSGRSTLSPMPSRIPGDRTLAVPVPLTRPPSPRLSARRRGSSRSRCSGRGCRPAPRGSRARSAPGLRASRSWVATIRPGVQKPHCTAPASRKASWIGSSSSSDGARPSTVTIAAPSAWPASTRHEHTSVPSRYTEHEPHSPCSQAFFEPGRPIRSRSTYSRLSPSQTSSICRRSWLTVQSIRIA